MRIESLKNLDGGIVGILGTGASNRVFPFAALKDLFIIGLNQAYKYHNCDLVLTVHPELVTPLAHGSWVVKCKKPPLRVPLDDPQYYAFHTSTELDCIKTPIDDTLYLAKGIQCTGLHLAYLLGARLAILIGVDMGALGGEHHGHDQHVQFHGLPADTVYKEYRKETAKVRRVVRDLGMDVLTLSPFLGTTAPEDDYARLCKEFGLNKLPTPKDVSTYTREVPNL